MESWRNALEGKSPLLCDEIGLSADVFGRTRKVSMGWNLIPSCNFPNMVGSSGEAIESMEFMELGLPDVMMKSDPSNPSFNNMGGEIDNNFSRTLLSPASMITSNSSFGKSESELSLSSPVIVSNSHKSSLIDLKLGSLANWTEAENSRFPNERLVSSLSRSSSTSKRARTGNLYSQNPVCQVLGCNKDLSSSKDYHKRNRVCDVHSKTAAVTVNGIEQRFCQQCSRFHLLAEFDDGRRSCRKRLAGHNERRRKPQLFSGKSHKLLQYYEGDRFLWTSLPKRSSFVFPDMLPGCYFTSQGNLQGTQCNTITMEDGPIYSPQLPTLAMNRQSHSKPVFHLHGMGKQCSFKDFSSQTGYTFLGTESTVQQLSGVSNSASAFSLLSAQTNPIVSPLVAPASNAHCGGDRSSEKHLGLSTGEKFSPHGFCSSGMMNSVEFDHLSPQVFFDTSSSVDHFKVQLGGIFQRSDSMNSRSYISPENGPNVDLIQLSSHLQRVEQQRSNSMQVKLENDVFCSSFSTM